MALALRTPRLLLREWRDEDRAPFGLMSADPVVMEYLPPLPDRVAAIDDGFGRLYVDEIVAFTVPANRRSWRLMERLGMTRDPADDFKHPGLPAR